MGVSRSTTKNYKTTVDNTSKRDKALKLFQKLEHFQTAFFCSDACFGQNRVIVESVVKKYLGIVHPNFSITIEPQNDKPTFTLKLSLALIQVLKRWFVSPSVGTQILCTQLIHDVGHSVLLVLKKRAQGVYVAYVDPYAFPLKQCQLLAFVLQPLFGFAAAVPVIAPLKPRDTEGALWYMVENVTVMKRELWSLYLFYLCHEKLPNYKHLLTATTTSQHVPAKLYNKLVRLLPQLQEQGIL